TCGRTIFLKHQFDPRKFWTGVCIRSFSSKRVERESYFPFSVMQPESFRCRCGKEYEITHKVKSGAVYGVCIWNSKGKEVLFTF
ncbi:MAG: hypothetical protein ACRDF4_08185, partial [Rhabdochlamydiaceae bacterium]